MLTTFLDCLDKAPIPTLLLSIFALVGIVCIGVTAWQAIAPRPRKRKW